MIDVAAFVSRAMKIAGATIAAPMTTVDYTNVTAVGDYDPTLGQQTVSSQVYPNVNAARFEDEEVERDGVRRVRQLVQIAYKDLPINPTDNDTLVADGEIWHVRGQVSTRRYQTVPGVLWVFELRRP